MTIEADNKIIRQIAERGSALYKRYDIDVDASLLMVQLRVVHEIITPLRLDEFLAANDADFAHDIAGIHDNTIIGNHTRLANCFTPRFAVDQ